MTIVSTGVDLLLDTALMLALASLIGMERKRHRRVDAGAAAGVRTVMLVGLFGFGVTILDAGTWLHGVGFVLVAAVAFAAMPRGETGSRPGVTTAAALLTTYLMGALAGAGRSMEAAVVGLTTAAVLIERKHLHRVAEAARPAELRSALFFLVIAVLLLPTVPARAIDPWGVIQPRLYLAVVVAVGIVSALSLVAMRAFGTARGMSTAGVLAGLVDSDAAAGAVAGLARDRPSLQPAATRAIFYALATSFARNIALVVLIDPSLRLASRVVPVFAVVAIGVFAWGTKAGPRRSDDSVPVPPVDSPFAIRPAVAFAAMFAAVSIGAGLLQQLPWANSVLLTALGGLVSSAAVVASMGALVGSGVVSLQVAAVVSAIAVGFSAAIKPVVVGAVHPQLGWRLAKPAAVAALVSFAAGAVFLVS